MRKKLEDELICEKLKGRVQYFFSHYHKAHDHHGRFAVRVDGEEVFQANPYHETDPVNYYDLIPAIETYLDQPIEQSIFSDDPLVSMFAVLDRCIGKRTLMKAKDQYFYLPAWLRCFYKLRLDVEGISVPGAEPLMLSADGEIGLYMAEREIVENLDDYIEDFYSRLPSHGIRVFDETDFVRYLHRKKGAESISLVKTVGNDAELPEEWKGIRWYNF